MTNPPAALSARIARGFLSQTRGVEPAGLGSLILGRCNLRDVGQGSVLLVKIQPVAYDPHIRDIETQVVDVELVLHPVELANEGTRSNGRRVSGTQEFR